MITKKKSKLSKKDLHDYRNLPIYLAATDLKDRVEACYEVDKLPLDYYVQMFKSKLKP